MLLLHCRWIQVIFINIYRLNHRLRTDGFPPIQSWRIEDRVGIVIAALSIVFAISDSALEGLSNATLAVHVVASANQEKNQ